jgi:hypothetical protein
MRAPVAPLSGSDELPIALTTPPVPSAPSSQKVHIRINLILGDRTCDVRHRCERIGAVLPSGDGATRNPPPAAVICGGRKSPKKKPTAAQLRNWRVAIVRAKAQQIGTVAAPDRAAAEAEAVKLFRLNEEQRKRLAISERS